MLAYDLLDSLFIHFDIHCNNAILSFNLFFLIIIVINTSLEFGVVCLHFLCKNSEDKNLSEG